MERQIRTMEVQSIVFESNDPEVVVRGAVRSGHMQYETEILLSQTQLNSLVNQLQRQNSAIEISTLFNADRMYNNEFLYSAELAQVENTRIDFTDIMAISPVKQIRA